jgi:cell growth-regulating nucleolar protein
VTEHEKYALGATKPGGYAASGFSGDGAAKPSQEGALPLPSRRLYCAAQLLSFRQRPTCPPTCPLAGQAEGLEFLTTRPPWRCTICNVTCTSRDALNGHATGAKHKRRVRKRLGGSIGSSRWGQPLEA